LNHKNLSVTNRMNEYTRLTLLEVGTIFR